MIAIAFFFLVLGALIKYGKMYFLISGYNTMSVEEKSKYDIKGIANLFWKAMLGMAIIIALGTLLKFFFGEEKLEMYAIILAVVLGVPYLLIQSNSKRYKLPQEGLSKKTNSEN
tara:strand:+ start:1050 stop:1391 length:342 start_codon:yes stop_codon:yes gene_type:complete